MNASDLPPVLVVGAGIMGAGIAQVAAQAGHRVMLFDARDAAAATARDKLGQTLHGLVAKGRLSAEAADAALARIAPIARLEEAADAGLVVEAIVENLEAKRALLRQLEALVSAEAVLASNTSSISITALANGLRVPGRVVGMHFFNPVPLMKLVEVVSGLQTDAAVAERVFALATAWGKTAVHARSTPGFIVNRIARPYYAETLALLQERASTPAVLDACLRGAGFRMGPCELMDLIGHDTNFSVTESVYQANFGDKRFQPSLVQREMVDGGLLGRKSGRGFYAYGEGAPAPTLPAPRGSALPASVRWHGAGAGGAAVTTFGQRWCDALAAAGVAVELAEGSGWIGLEAGAARLALTDGRTATERAQAEGCAELVLFDLPIAELPAGAALACAGARSASEPWLDQAAALLACAGVVPQQLDDAPGLVVARTVAMLVNEAADAVQQGVCSTEGADLAMKLGVNYPAGPFEWLARWEAAAIVALIDRLDAFYRGERYRVSPWLRRRGSAR
ncbi:3-hydroxyacyl-CoA dehydrogenase [Ideonella sp.]|uniref:3-hydroxyacyl-CoA dehydrogenase n=1 Tax=Ideonella sp. TaxID=1929293 RepID=UPI002B49E639|nr:3-hydroxyacyl-CoA dehydrogenase [Ideonella sp.]HJV69737.1 3-hydroxyacyl-CoA dehydrogenase [Ideonella sp.]